MYFIYTVYYTCRKISLLRVLPTNININYLQLLTKAWLLHLHPCETHFSLMGWVAQHPIVKLFKDTCYSWMLFHSCHSPTRAVNWKSLETSRCKSKERTMTSNEEFLNDPPVNLNLHGEPSEAWVRRGELRLRMRQSYAAHWIISPLSWLGPMASAIHCTVSSSSRDLSSPVFLLSSAASHEIKYVNSASPVHTDAGPGFVYRGAAADLLDWLMAAVWMEIRATSL